MPFKVVLGKLLRAVSGGGGPAHAEWIPTPEPVSEEALNEMPPDDGREDTRPEDTRSEDTQAEGTRSAG